MSTPRRREWLAPLLAGARSRDRIVSALCGGLSVAIIAALAGVLAPDAAGPFLASSIGSSTVLLFAVPTSPLASPWATIGGSIVSTASGIAMVMAFGHGWQAAAAAIIVAILAMSALRCLHPPGGGYALTPVVANHGAASVSWAFLFVPVAAAAVTLVLCAIAFHRLATGHSYPHRTRPMPDQGAIHSADIDAALIELGETFDISREDLNLLLETAERHAQARVSR